MNGPLRQLKCSGSLITRQGQPEAPSEHEPLALPLAAETKRHGNADPSVGRRWRVGVTGLNLAGTEKPPYPIKGFFKESHK